jgi:hypothetical protein
MSFIQVIEQLGANAALQQLNQAQLTSLLSDTTQEAEQLNALLLGNVQALSELLEVPVYRCVAEVPAEEEEQPAEQEEEKTSQQSVRLQ